MERKVALVTGASRGIGRAIARQLAADGLFVIVNYRQNADAAETVCREIVEAGGSAQACQFDIAEADQVAETIPRLAEEFGPVDVLVNNAAAMGMNPLMRVKQAEWEQFLMTNLGGLFACTKAVMKVWAKQRYGSRIINITSGAGERGFRFYSIYSATKSGMIGFTKSLSQELGSKGVTVNAVSPGFIETDSTAEMNLDEVIAQTPLGRAGQPEDVADLVSFLASDRARFITGQVIRVNGGFYM